MKIKKKCIQFFDMKEYFEISRVYCIRTSSLRFVKSACSEQDIVVTTSAWCMCVHALCVLASI